MKSTNQATVNKWINYARTVLENYSAGHMPFSGTSNAELIEKMRDSVTRGDSEAVSRSIDQLSRVAKQATRYEKKEIYLECGLAAYAIGDLQGALLFLRQSVQEDTPEPSVRTAVAYLLKGVIESLVPNHQVDVILALEAALKNVKEIRAQKPYSDVSYPWLADTEAEITRLLESFVRTEAIVHVPKAIPHKTPVTVNQFQMEDTNASDTILTPTYLLEQVAPFLKAMEDLQSHIGENGQVRIKNISQNSPLQVTIEGITQAVNLFMETVVPWRKRHAQVMANLIEEEKRCIINLNQAALYEQRSHRLTEGMQRAKLNAEIEKLRLEAESMRLQNEEKKLQIEWEKKHLVEEVLRKIGAHPGSEDADRLASQLVPVIEVLVSSTMEIAEEHHRVR